jgi:hypothetical protein
MLEVPVTARVGVAEPDKVTELTEVGIMAPNASVIAGVVVELATEPDIPLAVTTETDVTVPVPPPPPDAPTISIVSVNGLYLKLTLRPRYRA